MGPGSGVLRVRGLNSSQYSPPPNRTPRDDSIRLRLALALLAGLVLVGFGLVGVFFGASFMELSGYVAPDAPNYSAATDAAFG